MFKNIDHIYIICHRDKETVKYDKWNKWMKFNQIPESYITFYCYKWGDELSKEDITEYHLDDGSLVRLFPFRANFPLKLSEISLSINFLNIFKEGIHKKYNNILVFESDAILHPSFITEFNKRLLELYSSYSNWHMLSLGCGMNKHINSIKKNKHIYLHKEVRCLDSFVISLNGMKKITELLKKVSLPIDEHIDILVKQNKIIMLWLEPTLVVQGSQTGINPTTIRYSDSIYVKDNDCEWLKDVQFK
jgi:hypothetical protein